MTTFQKIIKYFALCLALSIIINIVYGGVLIVSEIGSALNITSSTIDENYNENEFINSLEPTLTIDLDTANLELTVGDKLLAESNNQYITCTQNGNNIFIIEKNHNWFKKNKNKVTIFVPKDIVFESVNIKTGAGKIDASQINSKNLSLEMGAGKVLIKSLTISTKAKIDGGVGKVEILSGQINNLDLEIGIGKFTLNTILTGNNKIEAGIGNLMLNLTDDLDNYRIKVEKGIGSINIDGKSTTNNTSYGSGNNTLEIEGGIGSINVN